ncbi:MAG: transglutaminase-like cysteine peptidase [Pseudomonadota bacterium]|nr:transglutaminase-like cysteine peptidase [Pseudomonadota bacterium]MDE3037318.1 transglutaminase-like cysteine peptidase [Pseudomonadota bacterium]
MMRRLLILLFFFLPVAVTCTPAAAYSVFESQMSYFDMRETSSTDLKAFTRWTGMEARFDRQKQIPDSKCGKVRFHPCSILDWKALLASIRKKPLREQLDIVNDWGNAHPYIVDELNWGEDNYWETPYEFMEVSGNCKDYAIAKYYSMRALGIPAERLRVIVLQDLNLGGILHAVLGIYDGGELLILDNQARQVLPALRIYHYRPIYGINENGWWAYYPKRN